MIFYLVTGLPHSGKSTWINNNVDITNPAVKIIDIYHIQSEYCDVQDADELYAKMLDECDITFRVCAGHEVIVIVEAALLMRVDRKLLSDKFKSYAKPDDHLVLVWCDASENDIIDRLRDDGVTECDEWIQDAFDKCEFPVDKEGFDELIVSKSKGHSRDIKLFLARFHCGYRGSDPREAEEILDAFANGEGEYRFGDTYRKKMENNS